MYAGTSKYKANLTSTRGRRRGGARGITRRRVRSGSPVNRGCAEVSTVRWGNLDDDIAVSFPDFRGQHGPVTLQVTESEPYDCFSLLFPEELWDVSVEQTSIYFAQRQRKSWVNDTNKDEMKAIVGPLFFYRYT